MEFRIDQSDGVGPFDIVGDVHGCCDELELLLAKLGYAGDGTPPSGRKAVFVGDLVDRGPRVLDTLRLVRGMIARGQALCVLGNHDDKLGRWLAGNRVTVAHGLDKSIEDLARVGADERDQVREFLQRLPTHLLLDEGRLAIAHAGILEHMHGKASAAVRSFCLYGDVTGEKDEYGLPVRGDWAAKYAGKSTVVYGHTPVPAAIWRNRTINLDTGCVFGGSLTALRYPEMELMAVKSVRQYTNPSRPFVVS